MKILYRRCAGIDVHKNRSAYASAGVSRGKKKRKSKKLFLERSRRIWKKLAAWLKQRKVRQVAMESTGVYWIPVWNILERKKWGLELILVNPATVRALRGQKTDRIDARRIAEYLQYGLLRASFVPPRPVRQLRDLTRMRAHIQGDRNRVINRIGRLLETVNIKLGSVASNIVGKSGRAILRRLAEGSGNVEELAKLAMGTLKKKIPDLILALDGRPDEHFRWSLKKLLRKLDSLDTELADIDARLCEKFAGHAEVVKRLCTIPGVDQTTARILLAELGTDMTQFPTAAHAASRAGFAQATRKARGSGSRVKRGRETAACAAFWCRARGLRLTLRIAYWAPVSGASRSVGD